MIEYCSLKGLRENNQDALAVITVRDSNMEVRTVHHDEPDDYTDSTPLPEGTELLLVADGMGGLAEGDQASYLTLTFFLDNLQSGFEERIDMSGRIQEVIQRTSPDLRDNCPDSGSTLVGLMTVGRISWMFNVGDSKCLLDTHGRRVRSVDHSATQDCDSNIINAYIGMEGEVPANIVPIGDCGNAILFTDGLNPVFLERGLDLVDSKESAEFLCRQAIQKGSQDNVTCIVRREI